MLILFILAHFVVIGHSESSSLFRQARRCCSSVRVSSPSLAGDAQADKMGLYRRVGAMNGRHVYRHVARHVYLYYYDWDGRGTNWMMGPEAGGQSRGVQSINLKGRALAAQWCPEDMHQARFPWEVYNSRGRWVGDTRLRVECFDEDRVEDCCKAILVKSVSNKVPSLDYWVGVYTSNTTSNGRPAYRHLDKEAYIYYYDWGPNSGTNWMIGDRLGSSSRFLETFNLETRGKTSDTECVVRENTKLGWRNVVENNSDISDDIIVECI